jgi:hypothetical protein
MALGVLRCREPPRLLRDGPNQNGPTSAAGQPSPDNLLGRVL